MTGQIWSADGYAANARFVADLGAPVLDLLDPRPGERILDLGCGDGALTVQLVARGATVVGLDAAPALVDAARARGLDVRLADAQGFALAERFDAVFTNAALHWMTRIEPVLASVRAHLEPGSRFVGEMGGHGNVAAIVTALRAALIAEAVDPDPLHPWLFPTVERWTELLAAAGFTVERCALLPRPTPLPTGLAGWLATFAGPFLAALPPERHDAVLGMAERLLDPVLRDERGRWTADYVRLRFVARVV